MDKPHIEHIIEPEGIELKRGKAIRLAKNFLKFSIFKTVNLCYKLAINKMKTENFKIIFIGLLIVITLFFLVNFIHTILNFTPISQEIPLGACFRIMANLPLIVAGIYVGFSKAEQNVLNGALIGIISYLIIWLMLNVFWPSPYFDHSFKPLIIGYGIVRNGLICSAASWLTNTILKRRRQQIN
ncbi:MAG: hypothetical protein ABSC11_07960 [Smithella sp.]|jgi:hypothetical protein